MWKKLKQKTRDVFRSIKNMSKSEQLVDTDTEEYLQRLENALNNEMESDQQMQVNGKWVSKSLIDSISANNCEQKLLKICRQKEVLRLEDIFPKEVHHQMIVLWSGCYSEVFRIKNTNGEDIVLKISLINRTNREGIVVQNASAIVSDVINSKRLSDLKAIPVEVSENYSENFVDVKNFLYVWSHRLVFNKSEFKRRNSQNIKYEYFVSQQTFGGKQLDSVNSLSPTKALSLVLQLTASLAVAEEALKFEHRDLHLSNLLIKPTDDKYLNYSMDSHRFKLKLNGIKLVIIDTTFSRTQMDIGSKGDKKEIKYFYNNLSTLNLDDYQNPELKKVYLRQKEITANVWKEFYPKTNTIWLTYCVNRIYQKVEKWSQKHTFANDSPYSQHLFQLQQIRQKVCDSNSAKDFAHICQLF